MKIGFLGGVKSGKTIEAANDYNFEKLKWMFKVASNRSLAIQQGQFQTEISRQATVKYDEYNLLILKKNKTLKFFYVLKEMSVSEIKELLNSNWDKSDILGYDFD